MKKKLLTALVTGILMTGCAMTQTTAEDLRAEGNELKNKEYALSVVENVEDVRLKIHTSFGVAEGIFNTYMDKVIASPDYHNYLNATQGKTDKEILQIRKHLKTQGKLAKIEEFENSNKELIKQAVALATEFYEQAKEFERINTTDAFAELNVKEKIVEGVKVYNTGKEVKFVKEAVGQIHQLYAISQASQVIL